MMLPLRIETLTWFLTTLKPDVLGLSEWGWRHGLPHLTLPQQFISTFKRDKLRNATDADMRLIAQGNAWAHGGGAVVDAMLYQDSKNRRRDPAASERLYRLDLGMMLLIGEFPPLALPTGSRLTCAGHKQTLNRLNSLAGGHLVDDQSGHRRVLRQVCGIY